MTAPSNVSRSIVSRLSRRSSVRMAAVAAVLAGTSLVLSGATAAAGPQLVRATLAYTCHPPSGWQPVPVQVAVSIPGTATIGQPIRPAGASVAVTLPRADAQRLAKLNTSPVSAEAQLRSQVTENGTSVTDPWFLAAVSAPVPSAGDLVLHIPGSVAPVIENAAGSVTFAATGLSLLLAPHSAAATSTPAASGGTSALAATRLACTLNPGQAATLATVPVTVAPGHGAAASTSQTLWEVDPGGSFSGTATAATLADASTRTRITCASAAMSGTLKSGRDLPAAGIGSMTSVTFSKCKGSGGQTFSVTTSASSSHPWLLNVQAYDPATTVVSGTVSGIMAGVSGTGCSATVAGPTATASATASAAYTNSLFTPTLGINPPGGNLHAWNVTGCSGLFKSGDSLTLAVTYAIGTVQAIAPAFCPPFPVNTGFPFNPIFPLPPYPPGSTVTNSPPAPPTQGCAYIAGFSDVKKLNEAALVGPGLSNLQVSRRTVFNVKKNYFQTDAAGRLYFKPCPGNAPQCRPINGLPPVRATFLSFGFMPTTATLMITQTGDLNVVSVGTLNNGGVLKYSKVSSLASIHIQSVLVNGTPLNVGSNCRTVHPFKLVLIGKPPYQLQTGGVLAGMIDVPPFTGCGAGENLDPIFTASVSGPGNFVKITQGNLCTDWPIPPLPPGCPATVPKPVH